MTRIVGLRRPRAALLAGIISVALLAGGCSRGEGVPKVAAVVQGIPIPGSETEALLHAHLAGQPAEGDDGRGQDKKGLIRFVLLYQIKHALLRQLANQMGLSDQERLANDVVAQLTQAAPANGFESAGLRPEDLARSISAGDLSKAMARKLFPDVPVTDEAVRQEYDRRTAAYKRSWKVAARVAPFAAVEPARQVKARVAAGEPFDRAASALGAGDVGSVEISPVSPLPPPVIDAVGKLSPGEVSEPIQVSTSGWASVFVDHRQELPELSLDDVRGDIIQFLADEQRQDLFSSWFNGKLQAAKIGVSKHYGRWHSEEAVVR